MTAIVTGAGTGIGAAIARELGRRGHRVAVTDLDEESARRVAVEIEGAEAFQLDVTDRASIEAVCDAACRSLGPLEVWAANAGVSTMSRFVDITEDEYDFNMTVNAKGVFLCGQVAARRLIEQGKGGAIVNTASTAGKWGAAPFLAHYVASKFAVIGITQAMAAELGPYRIRVNCVCPGFVTTEHARAGARLGIGASRQEHRRGSRALGLQHAARTPGAARGRRPCSRVPRLRGRPVHHG